MLATCVVALGSCTVLSEFGQSQCSEDSQCQAGGFLGACEQGLCQLASCTETADCTSRGEAFSSAVCVADVCAEAECVEDMDCDGANICVDGACVDEQQARWGCIDDRPPVGMVDGTNVTYRTLVKELNGTMGTPAKPEMTVVGCQTVLCDGQVFGPYSPDEEGWVDVEVNRGFQGIMRFSSPDVLDTILDLKSPVNEDAETDIVRLFSSTTVDLLGGLSGTTADTENAGLALVLVRDCLGGRAEGIKLTVTGATDDVTVFYVDAANIPAPSATSTDSAGVGGVVNLPPGLPQINLSREVTGEPLRSFTLNVQAGVVTYTLIQLGR